MKPNNAEKDMEQRAKITNQNLKRNDQTQDADSTSQQ